MNIPLIIDGIVIGIILIFTIIGANRGAVKSILSLFGWVLSLVISLIVVYFLGNLILEVGFVNNLVKGETNSLFAVINNIIPEFGGIKVGDSEQAIQQALGSGVLGIIAPYLVSFLVSIQDGLYIGMTVQNAVSTMLAVSIYYSVLTLILFIIVRIVFGRIEHGINLARKKNLVRSVDNLLGLVVGAIQGIIAVSVVLVIFSFVLYLPFLADIKLHFEQTKVAFWVAEMLMKIVNNFINIDGILGSFLG